MKKVLTHGCFDVLHIGHINHFKEAKAFGDYLIVSVTSDKYVNKGIKRPYFNEKVRMEALKGLSFVDEVILSDSPLAVESINKVKPNIFVKGIDYKNGESKFSKEEKEALQKIGAELIFTESEKHSSSEILNTFIWNDDQKQIIEYVKGLGGMKTIKETLAEAKKLNVTILGEAITDEYIFVDINGVSSKKPTLSTCYKSLERFKGGTLAIRNHMTPFVKSVDYPDCNTFRKITKTRYLQDNQHLFEVIKDDQTKVLIVPDLSKSDADITMLCDFGHGLFTDAMLKECQNIKGFTALNCQTNSSNYGFNLFTRHKRYDYLSIDLREAKLAYGTRDEPRAIQNTFIETSGKVSVTLGKDGAQVGDITIPAFVDNVLDPIGAGDAYFAMTSILMKLGCDHVLTGFMGNVFAGLKTKNLGNRPIDHNLYLKTLENILK